MHVLALTLILARSVHAADLLSVVSEFMLQSPDFAGRGEAALAVVAEMDDDEEVAEAVLRWPLQRWTQNVERLLLERQCALGQEVQQ